MPKLGLEMKCFLTLVAILPQVDREKYEENILVLIQLNKSRLMEGCFLIALRVVQRELNCSLVADETTPCNSGLVLVLLSIKDMTEE